MMLRFPSFAEIVGGIETKLCLVDWCHYFRYRIAFVIPFPSCWRNFLSKIAKLVNAEYQDSRTVWYVAYILGLSFYHSIRICQICLWAYTPLNYWFKIITFPLRLFMGWWGGNFPTSELFFLYYLYLHPLSKCMMHMVLVGVTQKFIW